MFSGVFLSLLCAFTQWLEMQNKEFNCELLECCKNTFLKVESWFKWMILAPHTAAVSLRDSSVLESNRVTKSSSTTPLKPRHQPRNDSNNTAEGLLAPRSPFLIKTHPLYWFWILLNCQIVRCFGRGAAEPVGRWRSRKKPIWSPKQQKHTHMEPFILGGRKWHTRSNLWTSD